MDEVFLPLLTLALGALLGLGSSLLASSLQHRRSIALRLLDQYLEVRKSIAETVAPLTNIDLTVELLDEDRIKHRNLVSELFYTHYDFLPKSVLDPLILLDVCLGNPDAAPYGVRDDTIVTLPEDEIAKLIDRTSLFRSSKLFFSMALNTKDKNVRRNLTIKLHARSVLHALNTYVSVSDLSSVVHAFKKRSK